MQRYCLKEFRNLTKESFTGDGVAVQDKSMIWELFDRNVKEALNECHKKNKEKQIRLNNKCLEKYGISEDEMTQYFFEESYGNEYYEINIPLEQEVKTKEEEKARFFIDVANRDTFNFFNDLISSPKTRLDIENEMYLALCKIETKKVKFMTNFLSDEEKKQRSDYFKNYHASQKNPAPFEGMPRGLTSEMDSFGEDIVRLWVSSKKFRGLFRKVETTSEKYKLSNFLSILDNTVISEKEETTIILNKLTGRNLIKHFYKCIYPYVSDFSDKEEKKGENVKCLEEFIKKIMELDGREMQVAILEHVKFRLEKIKDLEVKYRKRQIELYNIYLSETIQNVNKQYKELCNAVLEKMKISMSFDCWKVGVELGMEERSHEVFEFYAQDGNKKRIVCDSKKKTAAEAAKEEAEAAKEEAEAAKEEVKAAKEDVAKATKEVAVEVWDKILAKAAKEAEAAAKEAEIAAKAAAKEAEIAAKMAEEAKAAKEAKEVREADKNVIMETIIKNVIEESIELYCYD